jgi:uncharacterized protein YbcC (UPF0753/DUF2309 family)
MAGKRSMTQAQKNLTRRYLTWCYKTTKEALDRIDRYFTQLPVDAFVLKEMAKSSAYKRASGSQAFKDKVKEFRKYRDAKETRVMAQKYTDPQKKKVNGEYLYLQKRLEAVEKAVCHFLGKKALSDIRDLYEEEMTMRILEAREHT